MMMYHVYHQNQSFIQLSQESSVSRKYSVSHDYIDVTDTSNSLVWAFRHLVDFY